MREEMPILKTTMITPPLKHKEQITQSHLWITSSTTTLLFFIMEVVKVITNSAFYVTS